MGHSAAVRILVSEAVAVERGHGVTMTEEAPAAPGLRVLAHSESDLSGFTRPAADIFVYQGRTPTSPRSTPVVCSSTARVTSAS
jgi:hypothetical protein